MVKPFECEGFWWLPDSPRERVPGWLRCDAQSKVTIDLVGHLGNPDEARRVGHRIVFGEVDDCPVGRLITLTACTVMGESLSQPGLHRQMLAASALYGGRLLKREEDFRFDRSSFRFSGLDAWASELSGFTRESGNFARRQFSVGWSAPPLIDVIIPGASVGVVLSVQQSNGLRERVIRESVVLDLKFERHLSVQEINDRFTYPLQNLLTLACARPNALTAWTLDSATSPGRVYYLAPRTFTEDDSEGFFPPTFLFSLKDLWGDLSGHLNKWLDLHDAAADACNVYFGIQYAPLTYLDLRCQAIVQALTLYAASRRIGRSLITLSGLASLRDKASEKEKEQLDKLLADHPLLAAEAAVLPLVEKYGATLSPVIGDGVEFVNRISATLRYILRRDKDESKLATHGKELLMLTEQCNWMMKVCLLDELGFGFARLAEIIAGHSRWRAMRE